MKKTVIILLSVFLLIVLIISTSFMMNSNHIASIKKENEQYEQYFEKNIYGTDVITIINKASNQNLKNHIEKNEKELFIANDTNSIQIEIKMLNEGKIVTYPMETIQKVGTSGFIQNFNLTYFKCTNIEYHEKTKKISKIIFEQIEE